MPVTRVDLKVSREYHHRVAFSGPLFFVSIAIGLVVSLAMITVGEVRDLHALSYGGFAMAFVSAFISIRILDVKERPHKRLQRLVIETRAQKEWERVRFQ